METLSITTEFIKLDSLLKLAGAAVTGGNAKLIIADGAVSVNGVTCLQRGKKIYPGDNVTLPGYNIAVTKERCS